LVVNLAEFWKLAEQPATRAVLLTVLLGGLAWINHLGVRGGARLSNLFTVGKLLPLAVFLLAAAVYFAGHAPAARPAAGSGEWLRASLLIAFAYGGYDGAMMAMGEAQRPRRDAPFALVAAMLFLAGLYTAVQIAVDRSLGTTASERPLVEAARLFAGPTGGALLAIGAIVSVIGYLVANFLNAPRLVFALAEHGDAPAVLGSIHARHRTPHVAIWLFAGLVWGLSLYGNFEWNAMLSAVARLFVYAATCAALLLLRRRDPQGARLRVPGGVPLAWLGMGLCGLLVSRMGRVELLVLATVAAVAAVHWLAVTRRRSARA
jgi:amino acid transporter